MSRNDESLNTPNSCSVAASALRDEEPGDSREGIPEQIAALPSCPVMQ